MQIQKAYFVIVFVSVYQNLKVGKKCFFSGG